MRPLAEPDRERWAELYRGYAAFYEVPAPDLDHLWRRITELGELECLVAELRDPPPQVVEVWCRHLVEGGVAPVELAPPLSVRFCQRPYDDSHPACVAGGELNEN